MQVSLRKRATNYRALLRKRTYQDMASYASSPPCTCFTVNTARATNEKRKFNHILLETNLIQNEETSHSTIIQYTRRDNIYYLMRISSSSNYLQHRQHSKSDQREEEIQ